MDDKKIGLFMELAGQKEATRVTDSDEQTRKLGAQLLLSEVLEYVIKGLGLNPVVNGQVITDPDALTFESATTPDNLEMLDGLCDVAYTMYWNSLTFGLPIEEGFVKVCDNNLEKFVALNDWTGAIGELEQEDWGVSRGVTWPAEVVSVSVVETSGGVLFAVGKDKNGKVRKPSSFKSVDLRSLVA